MSEKKKVNKKSIEYVRPQMGSFDLKAFPGRVFTFRKMNLSDDPWCKKNLGAVPGEIIRSEKMEALTLCRMYFHFLTEESQDHFQALTETKKDDDTGKEVETFVTRPEVFMRTIDGGNTVELMLIANAFLETLINSRSLNDLPESLKKSLLEVLEKAQAKREAQPATETKLAEATL